LFKPGNDADPIWRSYFPDHSKPND
jgi:hypothetical protein